MAFDGTHKPACSLHYGFGLRAGRGPLRDVAPRHGAGAASSASTGSSGVHIGLLARRTPPPPTFSFDAIPKDEGFAGARAAIKDNDTTGAFTGHRYVLDEHESPVAAARRLV